MNNPVSEYAYVYGAGSVPNRKIEFYQNGSSITARMHANVRGQWKHISISDLGEEGIIMEGASTTKKMQIMLEARKANKNPIYPADQPFSFLPIDKKLELIKHLQPAGNWRIEISSTIDDDPRFEKIDRLRFFDPS